jgi:methionyl aminopeptidase
MENIESYKKAGRIAKQVVDYVRDFIQPGMLLIDIADKIDFKIEELGGGKAFPVNLSLNEVAAHYTPGCDDKTKAEGLLKIDLGVEINGYIADTAFSLDLTKEKKYEKMIKLNEKILNNALNKLNADSKAQDIGNSIYKDIKNSEFTIIKNLSGHSLGKDKIHAGLTISNYKNNNKTPLKNTAFAIEPFLTTGAGEVYESKDSEIFMFERQGNPRDREARKLLKFILKNYKTRPFCKRWLEKAGFRKINFLLKMLVNEKILHNFPILIEKTKKPVSQAEHTVLISDKVEITTR